MNVRAHIWTKCVYVHTFKPWLICFLYFSFSLCSIQCVRRMLEYRETIFILFELLYLFKYSFAANRNCIHFNSCDRMSRISKPNDQKDALPCLLDLFSNFLSFYWLPCESQCVLGFSVVRNPFSGSVKCNNNMKNTQFVAHVRHDEWKTINDIIARWTE